jgi:hypothetical protein
VIDRRAEYFLESKPRALEHAMDVLSLVAECRAHLGQAHEAHCVNDWKRYLDSVAHINDGLTSIRHLVRAEAAYIEAADVIAPGQLSLLAA